jgi:hypothetical protein
VAYYTGFGDPTADQYTEALEAELSGLGISLKGIGRALGKVAKVATAPVRLAAKGAVKGARFVAKHPAVLALPAAVAAPFVAPAVARVAIGGAKAAGRAVGIGRRRPSVIPPPPPPAELPARPTVVEEPKAPLATISVTPKPAIAPAVLRRIRAARRPSKLERAARAVVSKAAEVAPAVAPAVVEAATQAALPTPPAALLPAAPAEAAPETAAAGEKPTGGLPGWLLPVGIVALFALGRRR